MRKSTIIGIAVLGSLCLLALPVTVNVTAITPQTTYTSHPVITVGGDTAAAANAALAAVSGVTGSGTELHPYVISGFLLNGGGNVAPLNITNTTAYLTIQGCEIEDGGCPVGSFAADVLLTDASNVIITNDLITGGTGHGVDVVEYFGTVNNVIIKNNVVSANQYNGIFAWADNQAKQNSIVINNNTVTVPGTDTYYCGIDTSDSGNNVLITENNVSGGSVGINVDNATVTSNTITNSTGDSISVLGSYDLIQNNTCSNPIDPSSATGIDVQVDANDNNVTNNTCSGGGIGVESDGDSNTIESNTITSNNDDGIVLTGTNNTVSANTISEWSGVPAIDNTGTGNHVGTNTITVLPGGPSSGGSGGSGSKLAIPGFPVEFTALWLGVGVLGVIATARRKHHADA